MEPCEVNTSWESTEVTGHKGGAMMHFVVSRCNTRLEIIDSVYNKDNINILLNYIIIVQFLFLKSKLSID